MNNLKIVGHKNNDAVLAEILAEGVVKHDEFKQRDTFMQKQINDYEEAKKAFAQDYWSRIENRMKEIGWVPKTFSRNDCTIQIMEDGNICTYESSVENKLKELIRGLEL